MKLIKHSSKYPVTIILLIVFLSSCREKENYVFESIPPSHSTIHFENKVTQNEHLNAFYFVNYYNGGGVATGDINNDGLPDIYLTANSRGSNKLYLNKGDFKFEDITEKSQTAGKADWCTGVAMADVNADGWLDIYVCAVSGKLDLQGRNELYINNGKGGFTEEAEKYGLALAAYSCQAAFFDYDRDGDLDCFLLNQSEKHNATIIDTSYRREFNASAGDYLFQNNLATTGKFTDVSKQAGISQSRLGYGLGLAIADLNNDGWDDIYVGNDFHENDYYYVNSGHGSFTDGSYEHFSHFSRFSMGNDIADYDNDGQADVLTTDMLPREEAVLKTYGSDERVDIYDYKITGNGYQYQYSRNCLQHNNGDGSNFSDVALASGIAATDWSWSALMNDFDNDGNKDIFISSGIVKRTADLDYAKYKSTVDDPKAFASSNLINNKMLDDIPDGASYCFMYKGDGNGGFNEKGKEWGLGQKKGYYNGASYADLDNDGDLDLVVNALNSPAVLFRNNSPRQNYLQLRFNGDSLNRLGVGAKAWLFIHGKIQYQQLELTRGFQSSVEPRLHFGIAGNASIDSVLVVWPDQQYQLIRNVTANQQLVLKKQDAGSSFSAALFFPKHRASLEDASIQVNASWKHHENQFTDFNSQYLIPHKQSTRGPALAVADVNKDGLDDLYAGGGRGQGGTLLLQNKEGRFITSDTALFAGSRESEAVAAVFFDANGDGYPDLYSVSGGNEYEDGNPALSDHLYINDGKGHFTESVLPQLYFNKSTISVADIDKDGDTDLFVGGLADARKYGYPQSSYLLLNNGKGQFEVAGDNIITLKNIGITTTAAFTDINKDSWPDLVVTGEWMPVKIYLNNNGKFTQTDIAKSTGLWQTLFPADVNGDGNMDLLAGNWGHNSKLWSGKNGPLKLYVKDFDKNGSVEQIMCYTIDGNEYTFFPKDELEQALPVLKKGYLTYSEVAGRTVQFMFDDLFTDYIELKAETLSSMCFMGDGKGGFTGIELPNALQLSPLFAFAGSSGTSFIGAGNFYGVFPYEGRYDALLPTSFSYDKSSSTFITGDKLTGANGEARNFKWINYSGNAKLLVLARNNSELIFLKPTK